MTFPGHRRRRPARNDPRFHQLIQLSSTFFWDAYLKDEPEAKAWLLDGRLEAAFSSAGRVEVKLVEETPPLAL
jgi:hypothetical protein